jgi:hypothetical protein
MAIQKEATNEGEVMAHMKASRILLVFSLVLFSSEYLVGCIEHGPVTATNCSIATGANQSFNVSPGISASVGEPGIKAAQEAFLAYVNAVPSTALKLAQTSNAQANQLNQEAKEKAVTAAEQKNGTSLGTQDRAAIENSIENAMRNRINCAKAP